MDLRALASDGLTGFVFDVEVIDNHDFGNEFVDAASYVVVTDECSYEVLASAFHQLEESLWTATGEAIVRAACPDATHFSAFAEWVGNGCAIPEMESDGVWMLNADGGTELSFSTGHRAIVANAYPQDILWDEGRDR